jgi:Domain of unknown function (DUF397)
VDLKWLKSSRSGANECVDVAKLPGGAMAVRNSTDPGGAAARRFTAQEWRAFLEGDWAGEFD